MLLHLKGLMREINSFEFTVVMYCNRQHARRLHSPDLTFMHLFICTAASMGFSVSISIDRTLSLYSRMHARTSKASKKYAANITSFLCDLLEPFRAKRIQTEAALVRMLYCLHCRTSNNHNPSSPKSVHTLSYCFHLT